MKKNLFLLATLFSISTGAFAQQVIGEFSIIDGGFEAQTAGAMSSAGSGQISTQQTAWTVSSTGNSATREIYDAAANARTGNKYAAIQITATATNLRIQSPSTVTPNALAPSTDYTVQFFYKTTTNPGDQLDPGIYLNNTSGGVASNKIDATTFVSDGWTKAYATVTTGSTYNLSNWAVARITPSPTGSFNEIISFDDFVVYAGAYDDQAPAAVTTPASTYTVTTTADLTWTASTGIGAGGYVVVKYLTIPAADNDLNQNGIYAVGSTTTNGAVSLTGTVVYIGTNLTYSDTYTAGAYYKIYAVDQAFNYSDEVLVSDSALSVTQKQIAGLKVAPNPATDVLTISTASAATKSVTLTNLSGQIVLTTETTSTVDVSGLTAGLYIATITETGKTSTVKVVVE
jgi:hypothetical protein